MFSYQMHVLLLIAIVLLGSNVSNGADQSKYRTCDQTSFCRRQRNAQNIALSSTLSNPQVSNDGFTASFGDKNDITLKITRVIGNSIRIEAKETNRERYHIEDVLMPHGRDSLPFTHSQLNNDQTKAVFKWADSSSSGSSGEYEMIIDLSPKFGVTINYNGKTQVLVNNNEQFYFETSTFVDDNTGYDRDNDPENYFRESFKGHTYDYDKGPCGIGLDFTFYDSKYVYGIPEHASSFALKSTKTEYNEPFRLWNLDVFEYDLDLPASLYGAIPFIISHTIDNSNGLFWFNAAETYIDVWDDVYDSKNSKNIRWMSEYGILEAFIILGGSDSSGSSGSSGSSISSISLLDNGKAKSHGRVITQYGALTGNSCLPPLFSLGHHQCRWNYNDINDVNNINNEFNNRNAPNDVIWLDIEHTDGKKYFTWDHYNFAPDRVTNDMIENVYNNGKRRMVTIVDPHIKKDTNYYIYNDIESRDLWVKTRNNDNYDGFCWPGDSRYPDFSNKEMRTFWEDQFSYDKYQSSNNHLFTWNDMNEPSVFNGPEITMPKSNLHQNGIMHGELHNLYGYWVHESTYNGLLKRSNYNERPFVLSRAFFAGSQKFGSVWTGDNYANWDHLKVSVPMLLSMSIAGLPFVGADVGGFFSNPDGELMSRWYELGSYYPFFRNHAHQDTSRREFWQFDEGYQLRMRHALINRYRILPYIYTLFWFSYKDLSPVMRPLWYEFNNDESTFARDDSFMLGNALYIQPIVEANKNNARVSLPTYKTMDGKVEETLWYDVRGAVTIYKGGNTYELTGYNVGIPVLRLGGTITPEKHRLRRSSELMMYDPYTLIISLNAHGGAKGYLYLDDTFTNNFEKNEEYYLFEFNFMDNKLTNKILHSTDKLSNDIVNIEIERIIIAADLNRFELNSVDSIQIQANSKSTIIATKEFGLGVNSFVIRKPNVKINDPFIIQLMKK